MYKPLHAMSAIACVHRCVCQPTDNKSFQVQLFTERARKDQSPWSVAHVSYLADREIQGEKQWNCLTVASRLVQKQTDCFGP